MHIITATSRPTAGRAGDQVRSIQIIDGNAIYPIYSSSPYTSLNARQKPQRSGKEELGSPTLLLGAVVVIEPGLTAATVPADRWGGGVCVDVALRLGEL